MRLLIPFLLLFFSVASHAALFADNEARDEIVKLRKYVKEEQDKRITELQAKLDASEKSRQALEKRLADMESGQKSQMMDWMGQIDRLNLEVSRLRGQLEVNTHEVEQSQQRQQQFYTDLDTRMRKLESGTAGAVSVGPTANATPSAAVVDSVAELKNYEAAHELFKAGKYKESADSFEKFVQAYPNSKYAPSAQYWIGYANFSQKNYKAAIASQQVLIQRYPDNQKVPDAMFNIANSQIQLADLDAAKQTLRALLDKYPNSDAAPLAKKRLTVLESVKSKN
jgi:tol-pal system protein YbgF